MGKHQGRGERMACTTCTMMSCSHLLVLKGQQSARCLGFSSNVNSLSCTPTVMFQNKLFFSMWEANVGWSRTIIGIWKLLEATSFTSLRFIFLLSIFQAPAAYITNCCKATQFRQTLFSATVSDSWTKEHLSCRSKSAEWLVKGNLETCLDVLLLLENRRHILTGKGTQTRNPEMCLLDLEMLVITNAQWENQIKSTVKCHLVPLRWTVIESKKRRPDKASTRTCRGACCQA